MRTRHSLYNFMISALSSIIIAALGFLKVRFFVDLYGSEMNGLQLVFMQVITYLNIFELSFSLAFRQLLFKPLAENNQLQVLKVYHTARKIFKTTGVLLLVVGLGVGVVIPLFTDAVVSYSMTVTYFLILVIPYSISYFLMGPNFVIMADQKEYKISIWIQTIAVSRMIFMIIAIYLKAPVIVIFVIESGQIILANYIARRIALKNYPWLKTKGTFEKDKAFIKNVKYTTIHRLATIANNNTDNLVIGGFLGLTAVSIYGSYSYLTDAVIKIINSVITSPINSFGNLFSDESSEKYNVFTEFFNFSSYLATIIGVCVFVVMNQFVFIWMNRPDYVLPIVAAVLFALNIYYLTQREAIIITRDANGLFEESKNNAYLMVVVKITLSLLLINEFGIIGVLLATTAAYWGVDFLYNPILVYKRVFNLNPLRYYKMVLSRVLVALTMAALSYMIWGHYLDYILAGKMNFVVACLVLGSSVFVIVTIIYAIAYQSFRNLVKRFYKLFTSKGEKGNEN